MYIILQEVSAVWVAERDIILENKLMAIFYNNSVSTINSKILRYHQLKPFKKYNSITPLLRVNATQRFLYNDTCAMEDKEWKSSQSASCKSTFYYGIYIQTIKE